MADIIKFKGAGLPSAGIAQYKQALQAARDQVSVGSGMQFLRLTKDDGTWVYGQEDTEIEAGSLWAINPMSLEIGVIAWPPQKSSLKEPIKKMRKVFDVNAPVIDKATLPQPANGGDWDDCVSFELQCIGGVDEKGKEFKPEDLGVSISYQQNSYGGKQAFDDVAKELMLQLDRYPDYPVPVVQLTSESYQHPKWGTVWKPIFDIVKWVGMDGSEGESAEEEQEEGDAQSPQVPAKPEPETPQPAAEPQRRGRGRPRSQPETAAAEQPAADQGNVVRRRRR